MRAMYEAARADGCSHEEADRRVADQLDRWRRRRRRAAAPIASPSRRSRLRRPCRHRASPAWLQDVRYAARLLRRQPRHALLTILHHGARHRRDDGALQRHVRRADEAVAVAARRPDRRSARRRAAAARRGSAPSPTPPTSPGARTRRRSNGIAAWSQRLVTTHRRGRAGTDSDHGGNGHSLPGARCASADRIVLRAERRNRRRSSCCRSACGGSASARIRPSSAGPCISTASPTLSSACCRTPRVSGSADAAPSFPYSVRPTAGNSLSMFNAIAVLRPGVTPAQAAAEGTARGRFAADTGMTTMAIFGSNGPVEITAQPLRDALTADVRRPLIVLLVAVGLLLVTATANVASLQLARTTHEEPRNGDSRRARGRQRARDAAAARRKPASRPQLVVRRVSRSPIVLHRSLPSCLPADFPRLDALGVDAAVLTFALVVSVGTSIAFGLLPRSRVRRLNLVEALAEDGTAPVGAGVRSRTARHECSSCRGRWRLRACCSSGASLLGRSFLALVNADRGYDLTDVLSARVSMPATMYPAPERRFAIIEQVLDRLAAMPGITEAAFTSELPLTPGGSTSAFDLQVCADGGIVRAQASPRIVSPRYFSALRIATIAGRVFSDSTREASEPVVVVNRAFARRYLGDSPLGSRLPVAAYAPPDSEPLEATVIGVVDDVRYVTGGGAARSRSCSTRYRQMGGRLPVQTVTLAGAHVRRSWSGGGCARAGGSRSRRAVGGRHGHAARAAAARRRSRGRGCTRRCSAASPPSR